ncbi:hypothetical protein RhiirC2_776662 [Rhizophagus irregularis]|uniref:Protein kinase domain-containing protein n=3 Tax=Rhizophagus irregularis TaxID=588596 RepID=A0A2N1NG89_9GLOM|nr:hypothetical protein RhiirC2_776662 [Rhizophagus irregularis]
MSISGTQILLWCLVRGGSVFNITIERNNRVSDLKKAIKNKKPNDFANVDADRLTLWMLKNTVNINEFQSLFLQDNENDQNIVLLKDMRKIESYWPEDQNHSEDYIHVVVVPPVPTGQVGAHSLSPSNADNDMLKRQKLIKEYRDTIRCGLEANSPSVKARPEKFFKDQQTNPILNGRPLENTGPPIALFNNTFSLFLNDFHNENLEITSDFLIWTEELILAAADSYDNEEERNEKIRVILMEKLGAILLIESGKIKKKCKSDGIFTITSGLFFVHSSKNDPTIQGAIYYRDYWSQQNVEQIRNCCCAPSFIIAMVGAWFCILGGVFLSRVVVQPLTDLIPLTINLQDFDEVRRIARLFYSLSRALQQLSLFYQNLKLTPSDQQFFPYIRHDDNEAKTLWGFKMVIMEYISAISLDQKFIKGEIKTESCKVIYEDIKQAIGLLHEKNFVFADLRASNILIIDTEENQRAMLVDFDWCGKSDEDRYSPSMNKNISWPPGAKPRTLLRKDHDLYWLDVLLRSHMSTASRICSSG